MIPIMGDMYKDEVRHEDMTIVMMIVMMILLKIIVVIITNRLSKKSSGDLSFFEDIDMLPSLPPSSSSS